MPPAPKVAAPPIPAMNVIPKRTFTAVPWAGSGEGEKVIIYGREGMGKTTLAAMAPDPVFVGCDDGGRKVRNPKTGKPVLYVPGVDTFADVRSALQSDVFDEHLSVVIDTATALQQWALPYVFATIPHEKGQRVMSVEGYGFGKGYRHLYDTMQFVLSDLDRLVRKGKHIIILCQSAAMNETNTGGENYLCEGPDLHHSDKCSIRNSYIAWVDHVLRINWENATVDNRKITPVSGRVINVHPDATFRAKSRTLPPDCATIAFSEPADDSLWTLLLRGGA